MARPRPTPPKKASDIAEPPKRRIAALIAQRGRLMLEIAALQRSGRASQFITNAEELLTRWWGTANWNARQELLKSASWMLQLEGNRSPGDALHD